MIFFNLLRQSKTNTKSWITREELLQFPKLVIWVAHARSHRASILLLGKRIYSLVRTNGFQFSFQYLKESLRLTIRAIAGSPEPKGPFLVIRVSRDTSGFPTIIPLFLRRSLRDHKNNVEVVRSVVTMLSVFRVFKTIIKPDLGTITSPFTGINESFHSNVIASALNDLKIKIRHGKFIGYISESAGPNSRYSTWGASLDALSFLENPRSLLTFIKLCVTTKSYGWAIWLISLLMVFGPAYAFCRMTRIIKSPMLLGKLGVVYDQAGKARIVASTNWWIQLALYPLHLSIFTFLKTLPCDGTFDQSRALTLLMRKRTRGHKFYSYDLSAATDRLPIRLQSDILNSLGLRGDLWSQILDIGWFYKGNVIRYAVGQPMGAYSSWAMLALTHHVIVRVAALKVGIENFDRYAILGDDIVIHDNEVAAEYLNLMTSLGVSINLSKSLVSVDTVEFAKRWISGYSDYSPLGAGNLLTAMRYPPSVGTVLLECFAKQYADTANALRTLVVTMPSAKYGKYVLLSLWTCLGINKTYTFHGQLDKETLLNWYSRGKDFKYPHMRSAVFHAISNCLKAGAIETIENFEANVDIFDFEVKYFTGARIRSTRLFEKAMLYFSPGYWLYYDALTDSFVKANQLIADVDSIKSLSFEGIAKLIELNPIVNPTSLLWEADHDRRIAYKRYSAFLDKIELEIADYIQSMEWTSHSIYNRW